MLAIQGVGAQGRLNATVYGQPLVGWWDEEDRRITFLRLINRRTQAHFKPSADMAG
jgi:hypothetical protein